MNKKGRPTKSGDDAREALIAAARQKFVAKSYDKVSIRELAQLAGVSSAMINYYFQGKEGLYKAMIMTVTGQVLTNIQHHLNSSELDNLESFFVSFVEVIKQTPEFPLLMLKEVILNQGVCRSYFIEAMGNQHMKIFDQIYQRFHQAGKLKPGVDPLLFRLSLMSLLLFPWYAREVVGLLEGVQYDDDFLAKMTKHNSDLMQFGCFNSEVAPNGENNHE